MRASMLGGLSFASKSWKRALSRKMAQATIGPLTADFAVCAALALVSLSLSSGNRARVARLIVSAQHCGEDPAARRRRDTIEHQQWNPVAVLRAHRHKRAAQIARALVRPFLDIRVDQHRETFFPRSFERSSAVFPPAEPHNVAKDETDRKGGEKVARRQCFQAIAPVTDCVAIPEAGLTFDTRLLARFCARHGCGRDCPSDGTPGYSGDCEKTLCHPGRIKAGVLFLRRVDQITDILAVKKPARLAPPAAAMMIGLGHLAGSSLQLFTLIHRSTARLSDISALSGCRPRIWAALTRRTE